MLYKNIHYIHVMTSDENYVILHTTAFSNSFIHFRLLSFLATSRAVCPLYKINKHERIIILIIICEM